MAVLTIEMASILSELPQGIVNSVLERLLSVQRFNTVQTLKNEHTYLSETSRKRLQNGLNANELFETAEDPDAFLQQYGRNVTVTFLQYFFDRRYDLVNALLRFQQPQNEASDEREVCIESNIKLMIFDAFRQRIPGYVLADALFNFRDVCESAAVASETHAHVSSTVITPNSLRKVCININRDLPEIYANTTPEYREVVKIWFIGILANNDNLKASIADSLTQIDAFISNPSIRSEGYVQYYSEIVNIVLSRILGGYEEDEPLIEDED